MYLIEYIQKIFGYNQDEEYEMTTSQGIYNKARQYHYKNNNEQAIELYKHAIEFEYNETGKLYVEAIIMYYMILSKNIPLAVSEYSKNVKN